MGPVNSLSRVAEELKRGRRFLIVGHVMPDGDCIGSMLALSLACERAGKEAVLALPGPVPSIYSFLPAVDRIYVGPALPQVGAVNAVVILDTPVPERLGNLEPVISELRASGVPTILIDHHESAAAYADLNFIDPGAAAVGEIIFDLLKLLGWQIDMMIATCLYVTVATDTGGFRYETTTAATHRRVAEFIEAGANVREISLRVFEEKPFKSIEALRAALNTLERSPCGRVAWMSLPREVAVALQLADEHTDGIVSYGRMIEGVEVALFFREMDDGRVKVSFRSKNFVNASRLAAQFGGGGHPRAAGAVVQGELERVKAAVIEAAVAAVREEGQ
ncbi:DHH family phosphoesterase [Thermodesulfitimonas sp.]